MLELKDITIRLIQEDRIFLDRFSFTLERGDKAVIIGEEGNGKSTLLKYIYAPDSVESYCECSGSVKLSGRPGYLPQLMDEGLYQQTVAGFFSGADIHSHMDILTALGLKPDFLRSGQMIGSLSGGERVKIQLARLLMEEPDILLLDEPTNDLDLDTLTWLEGFIKGSRLPLLYVSHDETLIENTANVIIHMEQLEGKRKSRVSVTHAGYREYLSFRENAFRKQAQVAQKQRDDYQKQMDKWRRTYNRVDHEQASISRQNPSGGRLLKKKMKAVLAQGRRFEREAEDFLDFPQQELAILAQFSPDISLPAGKKVLDMELPQLTAGGRVLAENIRLSVFGNVHIGIIGANGAGKSTLLHAIWEQLRHRRDIIACFMPQDYAEQLDYHLTPVEYLAANYNKEGLTRARTFMGSMRFTREETTNSIGKLSGGQKAKILYLDMVLKDANVLILDEPTRNFSPLSGPAVRQALGDFGGCIISVSHDRKYLDEVCQKVYRLEKDGLILL